VRAEGAYKHGLKDGRETHYLSNGDKIRQSDYKDGKLNGKQTEWGVGGAVTLDSELHRRQAARQTRSALFRRQTAVAAQLCPRRPEGLDQRWYPSGNQSAEAHFHKGQRDGLYREWHDDADHRLKLQTTYKDGVENGTHTEWYADGHKKTESEYVKARFREC